METFLNWFANSPLASILRSFLALVIYAALTEFVKVGAFDFTNWQVWVIGALSACLPALLRWLNPQDVSFGFVK